ncbi:dynamin family protein [Gelidibacter maritimus]|uniref:Dynamin family protein n=1 Tax=Gelidibacter maritimus TaxID=2761487 RepID=A0A7W2M3T9_9FLAO|nr:dynamin family protein [Gelidibacter maritimus]MBA6152191.1 dynamin family protein [Gelidibacter maritimus]
MEKLDYLIEVASSLKSNDVLAELIYIKNRLASDASELILPIVGEFSSGKTTFINKLTEGKKLETATKPTTSVIYEIYFGKEKEKAEIIFENGVVKDVEDITSIKNDHLNNVKRIKIYDTSQKIANKTILVDTPGISSNNPKHLEALSSYLPEADAIFLFSDVNQQITNSLLDFISTNNIVHLPLYLVLTKKDDKTKEELESIKQYITKHIGLDLDNIISISAKNNDLDEFFQLMHKIQDDKNNIINKALGYRIEKTAHYLKAHIENLIENTSSESNFQDEIKNERRKLDRTITAIDNLIHDIQNEIDDIEYDAVKQFESQIHSKLNSLITKNSENIDNEAVGIINSTANLVFSNYQKEIQRKLYMTASERRSSELVPLRSIEGIDFSGISIGQLSYGMNLSEAGQSTVKNIATGIKTAAVIGAVAVTVVTAGAAGATAAATATATGAAPAATGTAAAVSLANKATTAINVADTASDLASMHSNRRLRKKIAEQAQHAGKYMEHYKKHVKTYDDYNKQAGQMIKPNQKLGFMEGAISTATDGIIGKPERKRMINNFLRESLNPEFKNKLKTISSNLLNDMRNSLNQEATITINQIEEHLIELEELKKNEKEGFDAYMKSLRQYLEKLS